MEEGGADEFSTRFIETLCGWLTEGSPLTSLVIVDAALCGQARDGNGSYQHEAIGLLIDCLSAPTAEPHPEIDSETDSREAAPQRLISLNISGCRLRDDDAHLMGAGLACNSSLERLVVDRTALSVQQMARSQRLSLSGVDFSDVDATLMSQLLLQNTVLASIDLCGTKPLAREIKVLSDTFPEPSLNLP